MASFKSLIAAALMGAVAVHAQPANVVDVIVNNTDLSKLANLTVTANLTDALENPDAQLTVFAPTNAAFEKVPAEILDGLSNTTVLTEVLTYHVLGQQIVQAGLKTVAVETLAGTDVIVTVDGQTANVNGAKINTTGEISENGIVYEIDDVLLPQANVLEAVQTLKLTALADAVTKAGLNGTLAAADKNFTVFGPTDDAFNAINTTNLSEQELTDVLTYHVVDRALTPADLGPQFLKTLFGNVVVSVEGNTILINGKKVLNGIPTGNGIVYSIDGVLLPQPSVVSALASDDNFSTLVDLVGKADLVSTLNDSEMEFTVFAPTNAAFSKLDDNATLSNTTLLAEILKGHVVKGALTDFSQTTIETLNGNKLLITIDSDAAVSVNGIALASTIATGNGVVYEIPDVLLPTPPKNVVAVITEDADLSVLGSYAEKAGLVKSLEETYALTVFAPINTAFTAEINTTLEDNATLKAVLEYHVQPVAVEELKTGEAATLLEGQKVVLAKSNINEVRVNGQLLKNGVASGNGNVWKIDQALVPPTAESTVVDEVAKDAKLQTLKDLVIAADLADTLKDNATSFTVFAPTDDAFAALGEPALAKLKANKSALQEVLKYHVVARRLGDVQTENAETVLTNANVNLTLAANGVLFVNGNDVTSGVPAGNGIVYTIDAVLSPAESQAPRPADEGGLSTTTIVLIVIGSIFGVALIAGAALFVVKKKKETHYDGESVELTTA